MYIRRTTIKSRKNGVKYFTYRLVESVRTEKGVRQRTVLNLGKDFNYPRELWPSLATRIEEILSGQERLFNLPIDIEKASQMYAARIIHARSRSDIGRDDNPKSPEYQSIDINSLELLRPRSVSVEYVSYHALCQLKLDRKLNELGVNKEKIRSAIGVIIGRMTEPNSELATHYWLQNHTGLEELIGYDFEKMSLTKTYQVADILLKHKEEIEKHLYLQQRSLFEFEEIITLYDLTNTYFEGTAKLNDLAVRGKSKEKRTDCPLVTLGLVLDGSGFPKRSKIFSGNVSEPKTLKEMIEELKSGSANAKAENKQISLFTKIKSTIVMDAGIATEDNVKWLRENGYNYLVVSRKRHREFDETKAIEVKKDRNCTVRACRVKNEETGEIELYCHSTMREKKDRAILDRFSRRFEESLQKLNAGLNKKGCVKKYDKVTERVGRLKTKYSKASKNYKVTVFKDKKTKNAIKIVWEKKPDSDSVDSFPGVYCLRTNIDTMDESTLWRTYTMLTDLEAVFRSLKTELGLRPIFHQKKK